jgi:glutamyl/glutaminyl-tRNA synthetase
MLVQSGMVTEQVIEEHRAFFANLVACFQERVDRFGELPAKVGFAVAETVELDDEARVKLDKQADARELARAYAAAVAQVPLPPSLPRDRSDVDRRVLLPTAADATVATQGQVAGVWTPKQLEAHAREFCEARGIKFGALVHPLRSLLTGTTKGPGLFDVVFLLGREKVLQRLGG